MNTQLISEYRGMNISFQGQVDTEHFQNVVDYIYGHPDFDDFLYLLVDFSQVTQLSLRDDFFKILAATDRAAARTNPHIRIAAVSTNPKITEQIASYHHEQNIWPLRQFDERSSAQDWLLQQK
ncbi:MAG: hypothetical protein ACPGES_01350 [Coraliomargarita sp.]